MKQWMAWLIVGLFTIGSLAIAAQAAEKGLSKQGNKFAKEAAMGGMLEVQLGKMAQEKAHSQQVKDFGARMVEDHGKANAELKNIAQQQNLTLPSKLDKKHQSMVKNLAKASGAAFDKQYMHTMVKDHVEDVAKFQNAAKNLQDPELKAWAQKTLPVLEEHLKLAKETAGSVGVDVTQAEKEGRKELPKKK